jgi:DASH complex subunit DAM1
MELTDEAATLASNTQQLNELHDALGTFNESFAGYLYALKMNAFCVEWKQVSYAFFGEGRQADENLVGAG